MYQIYVDGKILFDPMLIDEGYGVTNIKLTTELNKAGSLEFTLTPNHPLIDKLDKLKSKIILYDNKKEIWRGRILNEEKDFYNRKKVYCEGMLSYFLDSIQRPYDFKGTISEYLQKFLKEHNSQVDSDKSAHLGNVTVTDNNDYIHYSSTQYPKTLDEMNSKLIGTHGGYLKFYYNPAIGWNTLDYLNTYGDVSDQVIRFGENLLDLTEYINAENVFTVLIPLGAKAETEDGSEGERLTIKAVNNGLDYIENTTASAIFGKIWSTQYWDDVTIDSNLLTKGRDFLDNSVSMAVTLSIKAVDLHLIDVDTESIKLGDYIRVVSEPHGLDSYFLCSKIVLDVLNPDKTEYTLGTGFSAMTDKQVSTMKQSASAYQTANSASSVANNVASAVGSVQGDFVSKAEFAVFEKNVNSKISSVYTVKGSVETVEELPSSHSIGDVYNVLDTGANYVWTEAGWDKLSETVDLTNYMTKDDLPKTLPNPNALTINGQTYDGSYPVEITIENSGGTDPSSGLSYTDNNGDIVIQNTPSGNASFTDDDGNIVFN